MRGVDSLGEVQPSRVPSGCCSKRRSKLLSRQGSCPHRGALPLHVSLRRARLDSLAPRGRILRCAGAADPLPSRGLSRRARRADAATAPEPGLPSRSTARCTLHAAPTIRSFAFCPGRSLVDARERTKSRAAQASRAHLPSQRERATSATVPLDPAGPSTRPRRSVRSPRGRSLGDARELPKSRAAPPNRAHLPSQPERATSAAVPLDPAASSRRLPMNNEQREGRQRAHSKSGALYSSAPHPPQKSALLPAPFLCHRGEP